MHPALVCTFHVEKEKQSSLGFMMLGDSIPSHIDSTSAKKE